MKGAAVAKNEHGSELLVEGSKSYPQALAALREFRELVWTTVRTAVRNDLNLIAKSLGIEIAASEIATRARPDELGSTEIDGENANLGVVIRREKKEGWNLYYTLCWSVEEEDAPFYFAASIWFKQSALGDKAYRAIQKTRTSLPVLYEDYENKGSEVIMKRKLASEDMAQLPSVVSEVIREWAKAWSQVGGVEALSA
jgi:hypothetical protein